MALPYLIPNPQILGTYDGRTTLYFEDADCEVDVVVGYDIDGYKDITVQSVHRDYGRGSWGPDFLSELDEFQLADLVHHLCLKQDWKPVDPRNEPGYAPSRF